MSAPWSKTCPRCGSLWITFCGGNDERPDRDSEWMCFDFHQGEMCTATIAVNGWRWRRDDLLPYTTHGLDRLYELRSRYYQNRPAPVQDVQDVQEQRGEQ